MAVLRRFRYIEVDLLFFTAHKMKFSSKDIFIKFTEEILKGNLHFLRIVCCKNLLKNMFRHIFKAMLVTRRQRLINKTDFRTYTLCKRFSKN